MDTVRITANELRDILNYDKDTGIFTWRITLGQRAIAGSVARGINGGGYPQIRIYGTLYRSHRLAWLYITGKWPIHHIDHIDGNRSNNSFSNLRDVSRQENNQNRKRECKNSTHGFLGVSKHASGKYQAKIWINGKRVHLGTFVTPEDAHQIYMSTKIKHHNGYISKS